MSVNVVDNADVINKYVKDGGFTFPIVMNGKEKNDIASKYGVMATPTNIVISPEGKVIAGYVGFQPDALKKDFAKLGIQE